MVLRCEDCLFDHKSRSHALQQAAISRSQTSSVMLQYHGICCAGIKPSIKSIIGKSTEKQLQLREQPWELMLSEAESGYQIEVLGSAAVGGPHPQSMGPDLFLQVQINYYIKTACKGSIYCPARRHASLLCPKSSLNSRVFMMSTASDDQPMSRCTLATQQLVRPWTEF